MDEQCRPLNAEKTFAECEKLWADENARATVRRLYDEAYADFHSQVMVLDDDPTGVQTVHDIPVVTDWEEDTLADAMREDGMFFVLTNSRSFSAEKTAAAHREIAENACRAAGQAGKTLTVISRGDSTLRGHYPLETETLRRALEANGHPAFAGEVLCPFFREGGRFTLNGVHYVKEGDQLTPAAQTEFARDKTFGYHHSYLPEYIEEKSNGKILADQVITLSLAELRGLQWKALEEKLKNAAGYRYIVCDALEETDVMALAVVLMRLIKQRRHYMLRSAAAVPKVFGHVADRPLLSREEMVDPASRVGGLVIVGSHVKKTTDQLNCLRESSAPLSFLEFDVSGWSREGALELETRRVTALAEEAMKQGKTAVVYTSRMLIAPEGMSPEKMLEISVNISDALTSVVSSLSFRPRFLIAKGGITSSDVGVKALKVKKARVLGQAAPGIPVWKTGVESLFPGLSYIIFPGNVGGVDTLRSIVETLC